MTQIFMNASDLSLGVGSYVSPALSVMEINSEGVLCASGQFEEWKEDTLPW